MRSPWCVLNPPTRERMCTFEHAGGFLFGACFEVFLYFFSVLISFVFGGAYAGACARAGVCTLCNIFSFAAEIFCAHTLGACVGAGVCTLCDIFSFGADISLNISLFFLIFFLRGVCADCVWPKIREQVLQGGDPSS